MKRKIFLVMLGLLLVFGLFGCVSYPDSPLLVKTSDINNNPLNYDQHFISVKGTVTANGTQPSLQLGWYDLADETGTIAILTTPDVPKVGDEFWVSGTVIYATKVVGARTLSIVLQEKERIKMGLNYPLIIGIVVVAAVALIALYFLLIRKKKPVYEPIKKEEYIPERRPSEPYIPEAKVTKKTQETVIEEEGVVEGAPAFLIIKSGRKSGATFPLRKKVINMGRDSSNEIVIDDPKSSRQHAKIKLEGDNFVIYDLASSNGTFVNGEKITSVKLNDGDEIKIGDTVFAFKLL
ncbi:MAG TPA: FHA domain-containing protein [Caldisericia bacterium]|nr:FHA domain-containing protein [Caldisericia bacterium]HQL66998.1 FHA domain-containing protein [Caldisericia bacterium]HQN49348.1 FHA domain-containing protein [Caldisericia bacterium]HQP00462.1 FHA domain-containing protein [Caldisericia bacterium]